jgi:hypothetical protein
MLLTLYIVVEVLHEQQAALLSTVGMTAHRRHKEKKMMMVLDEDVANMKRDQILSSFHLRRSD